MNVYERDRKSIMTAVVGGSVMEMMDFECLSMDE